MLPRSFDVQRPTRSAQWQPSGAALWPLEEFRKWAREALGVIRALRRTLGDEGDIAWRAEAHEMLEKNDLDGGSLFAKLSSRWKRAEDFPERAFV
jgi:predicted secreted protein